MRILLFLSASLATNALASETNADKPSANGPHCMLQTGVSSDITATLDSKHNTATLDPLKPNADFHFENFVNKHRPGRYQTPEEEEHRRAIFHETLQKIDDRNAFEQNSNPRADRAIHGINKYADWSEAEFRALLGFKKSNGPKEQPAMDQTAQQTSSAKRPMAMDQTVLQTSSDDTAAPCHRNYASRGEIRNQGSCGDCWAFATAELLRSAYIEQHDSDPGRLSTQFLVDCVWQTTCKSEVNGKEEITGVNGCCGGNVGNTLKWIKTQGGIPTQAAYGDLLASLAQMNSSGPVSETGHGITLSGNNPTTVYPCKEDIKKAVTVTEDPVWLDNEEDMAKYVCEKGSVSIAVDASQFQTYKSGVIQASSCGTDIDHAVMLVGVNEASNAWIVQNSWGIDWGVAADGSVPSEDEYLNCPSLAKYGCSHWLTSGEQIKDACQVSCGTGNGKTGGYVYLAYGANTCGITTEPVVATSVAPVSGSVNVYRHVGEPWVGGWGGTCRCPDGQVYEVGDNMDSCSSLACEGGEVVKACGEGVISPEHAGWKVTCAGSDDYGYVGPPQVGEWGGLCRCPSGKVYEVGDLNDACGSLACRGGEVIKACGKGVISSEHAGWAVVCG